MLDGIINIKCEIRKEMGKKIEEDTCQGGSKGF